MLAQFSQNFQLVDSTIGATRHWGAGERDVGKGNESARCMAEQRAREKGTWESMVEQRGTHKAQDVIFNSLFLLES